MSKLRTHPVRKPIRRCETIVPARHPLSPHKPLGGRPLDWRPTRFLADPAEAEHAFALAKRLGSVHATAQELGTTCPSLRKAFIRHGLGMPARTPRRSASAPSPPPASGAVRRPRRRSTRCS